MKTVFLLLVSMVAALRNYPEGLKKAFNMQDVASPAGYLGSAVFGLLVPVLLAIFMAQNTDDVSVEFLGWEFTWPLWLRTLVSALVGALVWFGLGVMRRHRRRTARREDRQE